jgi:AbrB family looped-hinge helix DNA binding protein
MATRINLKGRVTIPRKVLEALRLSPGDAVEFRSNGSGEFLIRKAPATPPVPAALRRERPAYARAEARRRRRAAELLALLRGLD